MGQTRRTLFISQLKIMIEYRREREEKNGRKTNERTNGHFPTPTICTLDEYFMSTCYQQYLVDADQHPLNILTT